jgi:hypothetical protein
MKVWILYKEEELDFNQAYLDDVEIFDTREQAEQAAYWLNARLKEYDRKYNGWHVSPVGRQVREAKQKHKHRASCHGAIGELQCDEDDR